MLIHFTKSSSVRNILTTDLKETNEKQLTLQEKAQYVIENDHEFRDFIAQLRMKKDSKCLRPSLKILSKCIDNRMGEIKNKKTVDDIKIFESESESNRRCSCSICSRESDVERVRTGTVDKLERQGRRRAISLPVPLERDSRPEIILHLNFPKKLYKKHHEQLNNSKRNLFCINEPKQKNIESMRNICSSPPA